MSRRLMVVLSAGILFAVSLVVSAASLAQEGQAAEKKLTQEQRERFVEGAKEVAGLSESEIGAALKDPDAIEAVPVREEETQDGPASSARDDSTAAENCTTMAANRNYYNVLRQKLFSISGRKEWCFDYSSAVTFAPQAIKGYSITAKGREAGWTYRGVVERAENYVAFRGFPRGSHVSRFVLRFKACTEESGCITVYPQYRGVGNYDGTGYQRTRTLDEAPK